jgi:hypothetical protein
MTSSNLRAARHGRSHLRRWLSALVAVFGAFGICGFDPAAAPSSEIEVTCSEPSLGAAGMILVRCNLVVADVDGSWRMEVGGRERACVGVSAGAVLPLSDEAQCGVVGDEVWFWQRLQAPGRGSLRYLSWTRAGAWRLESAALLPERLMHGASVVTSGRWGGGVSMPYLSFRDRGWLGGSVSSTMEGAVTLVSEPAVTGFASTVLEELRRLRQGGRGETVREVQVLSAAREDYASGRSGPGWLVLELGRQAPVERIAEVVRHEVAHQVVGGAIRVVRSGRDVGWFLEGFAEYLGFVMARGEGPGRAALFRRFGEACAAASRRQEPVSDYDLGFLYAAAADGALWRSTSTGLSDRLEALAAGRSGPVVFGGREDFVGIEPRSDFVTALLAGATDAGAEHARGWMTAEERPELSVLAGDLGIGFAKESIATNALPLAMHERRDGLFEVTSVVQARGGGGVGVAAGDLVWPLSTWSGIGEVEVEVLRSSGWQRITLASRQAMRERWRVVSADEVEQRWFGGGVRGAQR